MNLCKKFKKNNMVNLTQRAAMFGLDARKMSVKKIALNVLFLANLRRLTFRLVGGDSYSYTPKNAAMFGLDARIALAIFGALSIITGAALYSALEKVETTTLLADLNEIAKAWEAYYLDTGSPIETPTMQDNHVKYYRKIWEIIESNKKGWKGPYLPYRKGVSLSDGNSYDHLLQHSKYGLIYYFIARDNTWTNWAVSGVGFCNTTDPCYAWIQMYGIPEDIAKKLDVIIDGSSTPDTGDFRIDSYSDVGIFYKVANSPTIK